MSGHSKWSTIKRQKGATDAKRGAAFTKAANAIIVAAREGGGNPDMNFKLRLTIEAARALNMPKDNIERAIARGTGANRDGVVLEEVTYEGFGPSGVAVMVDAVTDKKTRTAQEVRSAFDRAGGTFAGPGSVSHLFKPTGELLVKLKQGMDADSVLLAAADAGASDLDTMEGEAIIYSDPSDVEKVRVALTDQGFEVEEASISRKPLTTVAIEDEGKLSSILNLMNKLEELDDVQKVYSNFDAKEELLEKQTA